MSLSVQSFRSKRPKTESNLGNVHVQVVDYLRDAKGAAVAVQGINLKNGQDITVRLADPERFARLYLNPNEDMAIRVKKAEELTASRTSLREVGAARGNKSVPEGGVVSFTNVRPDLMTGELYARWSNAVVTDPDKELAMPATFEVRTTISKDSNGKDFTTAFIQAYFPRQAVSSENITKGDLDRMLSGTLADTGAPLRTNVAVVAMLDGEAATFAFRPRQQQQADGSLSTPKGVAEALLGTKLTKLHEAAAAAAIAAKADIPFDKLNIQLPNDLSSKMNELQSLYDGVSDGSIPATFLPGATLQPSRYTIDAILGQKNDGHGNLRAANTQEKQMTNRGFIDGMLGVRYVSNETGEIVNPVVKAMFADGRLVSKDSDYFVRMDLAAVGHEAFAQTHESMAEELPKLGPIEDPKPNPSNETSSPAATVEEPDASHMEFDPDDGDSFIIQDTAPEL